MKKPFKTQFRSSGRSSSRELVEREFPRGEEGTCARSVAIRCNYYKVLRREVPPGQRYARNARDQTTRERPSADVPLETFAIIQPARRRSPRHPINAAGSLCRAGRARAARFARGEYAKEIRCKLLGRHRTTDLRNELRSVSRITDK